MNSYLNGNWREFRFSVEHVSDRKDVADTGLFTFVGDHFTVVRIQLHLDLEKINFNAIFRFAGYSHLLGYRKPAADSFRQLLAHLQLNAADTLFIDDTPGNIRGAQEAGLHTIFLPPPHQVQALDPDNWSRYQGFTSSKSM